MSMNRRQFLAHSCAAGATATTLVSTAASLGAMQTAAAQAAPEYRAMVCILLAGGNDSYNMVVPTEAGEYAAYAGIRSDLALPAAQLLPLSLGDLGGRSFGLHPNMGRLATLVNRGDAALVANVGTLLEAFDPVAVENGTAELPLGLFSHADQIAQWQTARPDQRTSEGWAGRIADLMQPGNSGGVPMNISLSGTNTFQSGQQSSEFSVNAEGDGSVSVNGYGEDSDFGRFRTQTFDQLLNVSRSQPLRREFAARFRSAIDTNSAFSEAMTSVPPLATAFSANPLSQSLRQIARVIGVRDLLGATRQTFYITFGGWDHHDEVLVNQSQMLPIVSNGLAEFRDALVELGVFDAVTTFTISDFGRTLTSNGRGSDHGWGGHHVVMGGSVNGARLFGDYPVLDPASPLDVGRGIYAPTVSTDEYFADLALWFGVSEADLGLVLPNVRRFVPTGSGAPLGLFA